MPLPQQTTDRKLQAAALEIVRDLRDAGGSPLVPQTVLAADALAGAASYTVASIDGFAVGGMARFWDGTAEEELSIDGIDPVAQTITPRFTGLGYPTPGLQHDHVAGALVTTGLLDYVPSAVGYMLTDQYPVIIVVILHEADHRFALAGNPVKPIFKLHVECRYRAIQPKGSQMHENVWAKRQQDRARDTLNAIAQALFSNQRLVTDLGPMATRLGDASGNPLVQRAWAKLVDDGEDLQTFVAVMDVVVEGRQGW